MNITVRAPTQSAAHHLTPEQVAILDLFRAGYSFKIKAFAGSGKTAAAVAIAGSTHRRGVAWAFNRDAADDLKRRMPATVKAQTTHSAAWGWALRSGFSQARLQQTFRPAFHEQLRTAPPAFIATISAGLRRFYMSALAQPELSCVPSPNDLIVDEAARLTTDEAAVMRARALEWVRHIWEQQRSPFTAFPLGGDAYLKAWAVSAPQINAEFLILDEAQDTNPAVAAVFAAQSCQRLLIGDPYQSLYGWRGATDAMGAFPWHELPLSQSWRFGPELAALASAILRTLGEPLPLRGNPHRSTVIASHGHADAVVCRSNAETFSAAVGLLEGGQRPFAGAKLSTDLKRLAADAMRLEAGEPAHSHDLLGITSLPALRAFAETEDGGHLKAFVRLLDQHGAAGLLRLLDSFAASPAAGVVTITTAHRAKGLQWPSVRLGDDFARAERITDAERRLFYVAVTRAEHRLIADPELLAEYTRE